MAKPEVGFSLLTILKKELTINGTRMTTQKDFKSALDLLTRIDPAKIQVIITGYWPLSNSIEEYSIMWKRIQGNVLKKLLTVGSRENE